MITPVVVFFNQLPRATAFWTIIQTINDLKHFFSRFLYIFISISHTRHSRHRDVCLTRNVINSIVSSVFIKTLPFLISLFHANCIRFWKHFNYFDWFTKNEGGLFFMVAYKESRFKNSSHSCFQDIFIAYKTSFQKVPMKVNDLMKSQKQLAFSL